MKELRDLIGKHYQTDHHESEIRKIEEDLEKIYGCKILVGYDYYWSHKNHDQEERQSRKECVDLDWVINYKLYENDEKKLMETESMDGQTHELCYLKGNGNYIVIVAVE